MRALLTFSLAIVLGTADRTARAAEEDIDIAASTSAQAPLGEDYSCMFCHGESGTLASMGEEQRLIVSEEDLAADIHWLKGLRCHDCHGGNPVLDEYTDHRKDPEFRRVESPADMPGFCGRCHSDTEYMRRYRPSPRTDQETEYWTSGHGQQLRAAAEAHGQAMEDLEAGEEAPVMEDPQVATCINCHSEGRTHNILAVDDQKSTVYPTRVAETCATCHSDANLMAGRSYHDRPLSHNQYELWKSSVHGQALLNRGDLSAPTCNDCHGNHGAIPPEVDSVANACGTCHGKVAALFAETRMKHQFEAVGLPGCATCHGNHQTLSPTDEMLGMEGDGVCSRCHADQRHGATIAGAETARSMRSQLEGLKLQIAGAEEKIEEAERLGMEVRGPRFDLRQARDALTNARSQVHSFALDPVEKTAAEGLQVVAEVTERANAALAEHTYRRIWLAGSVLPILVVIVLLLLYIRTLPSQTHEATTASSPTGVD
jgi:predicted CXXCH cytochrome family protein